MARIGLKLYYLRTRERKLSQQAVAKAIGIRQATISHVEQGVSLPSCALLLEVSRFFDVTPTYLLDDERGVTPLPTERWAMRNSIVTVGMWIEAPPDRVVEAADGKRLCPLLEGEAFYDGEAVELRRDRARDAATRAIARDAKQRRAAETELERELETELERHPKKR